MLYLGIDQHARQLTISLRNDEGDVLQARQVSTKPEKVQTFFAKLTEDRTGQPSHRPAGRKELPARLMAPEHDKQIQNDRRNIQWVHVPRAYRFCH